MIAKDLKEWTVSNLFMVPLLKIGRGKLEKLGFVNSYLYNGEEFEEYPSNSIHLLFQPKSMDRFNNFLLAEREEGKNIVDEKDYSNGYVLVTYELPQAYTKDYALILEGRYSETSDEYQLNIPGIVRYTKDNGKSVTDMTLQHMVFSKYAHLKRHWEEEFNVQMDEDQELWTKPTIESETFKLSNYECITDNTGGTKEDSC